MPASGISSELSAHQMAPAGAIAHSRPQPSCFDPFVFLLRLATPALRLGCYWVVATLGLLRFYDVTDAGPASHRVRLWQGGPASTYCHFRLLVLLFKGTSFPRDRLLALPEFRKAPGLSGGRGEMDNGGRFVRSSCPPVMTYVRHFPFAPCAATVQRAPGHNRWGVSETTLPAKTQGRTLDCPFNFRPPRVLWWLLKCRYQVCNRAAVASVATGPRRGAL